MRPLVKTFVEDCAALLPIAEPVVEIGARPAEGQEAEAYLRDVFPGKRYIGCDIQEGPNVDQIEDIHHLSFADGSVGTVVCVEVLEHVFDPIRAVQEIHRVLRPGGAAILTSVMFMPIHAHPWDFWRFTPEGFAKLLEPFETSLAFGYGFEPLPEGVQGIGVKGPFTDLTLDRLPGTKAMVDAWGVGERHRVDFGPIRMSVPNLWKRTLRETRSLARDRAARALSKSRGRGRDEPTSGV
jgi:SAM-dependent methyltransferase